MFDGEKKRSAKPGPIKRNKEYKQVSGTVLISCYIASAAIIVIAVSEAVKCYNVSDTKTGIFYVILAVLGTAFSVFITVMNSRNKRIIEQNKKLRSKKTK